MIEIPLEKITYSDLERLLEEKWPESKTIDYKRDAYGAKDEDKKELLKDVSSFANSQGGDLIIGIEEEKGIPIAIPGITIADLDKEKLRMEGIIRQGLEPRVEFGIHQITTPSNTTVIIIRVKESLLSPHRVVFQGKFGEFWARSSAGKFSMDSDELRRAFNLSDSIYEQIRAFRRNRVAQISNNETPLPLLNGGKLILHLIPVSAFRSRQVFDVASMPQLALQFPPMGASGWDQRLNLDGHVSYAGERNEGGCISYTQFFRNGTVEAVLADIVTTNTSSEKLLHENYCEDTLLKSLGSFLKGLRETKVQPPIWCFVTVTGVKGAKIAIKNQHRLTDRIIDRDVLSLPEWVIADLNQEPTTILRPIFDLIWNAAGFNRSPNFDQNGKWVANW